MKTLSNRVRILLLLAVIALAAAAVIWLGPKKSIDPDKFSTFMLLSSVYQTGMEPLGEAEAEARYGVAASDVGAVRAYAATDGTAREFAIIRARGGDAANRVQSALGQYCAALVEHYAQTGGDEAARARGYVIRRTRNYVILTVSDGMSSGDRMVDAYMEKIHYDKSE